MEKKKPTPKCCDGCLKWDRFGENCWVYWEHKKHCTHHTSQSDITIL